MIEQHYKISKEERFISNGHKAFLVFFTGLSGSGKSTLANALEQKMFKNGLKTFVLDGDNVRNGINKDLSFTPEDRSENNRRIAEISKLFIDAGVIILAAFIAPYRKDRAFIKNTVSPKNFVEIYVSTSLELCEKRDVKGLYKKARSGEIKNMTGISSPYEIPLNPDIEINEQLSIDEATALLFKLIQNKLVISSN